jgi:hypothetical protein
VGVTTGEVREKEFPELQNYNSWKTRKCNYIQHILVLRNSRKLMPIFKVCKRNSSNSTLPISDVLKDNFSLAKHRDIYMYEEVESEGQLSHNY